MVRTIPFFVACGLLAQHSLFAQESPAPRPQTALTIGKDTTHITQPLDQDGFVDYMQAVDQLGAKGVTSQSNFEVIVRRVLGPEEILEEIRTEYYQKLGMEIGSGPFYQDFYSSFAEQAEARGEKQAFEAEYDAVLERPWKRAEFPRAASWVQAQSKHLDLLVSESSRLRYYTPYIGTDFEIDLTDGEAMPGPQLIGMLLPSIQSQRELARGLRIRANLYVGEGRYDQAWADLLAIHRISRLVSQGVTVIESLVGIAMNSIAYEGTRHLLAAPGVSDRLLARMQHDLATLQPRSPMWQKIDVAERFMGLDCVQWLARNDSATNQPGGIFRFMKMLKLINSLSLLDSAAPLLVPVAYRDEPQRKPAATAINWDITARRMNTWYDRIAKAMREPERGQRKRQFDEISEDLKNLKNKIADTESLTAAILQGKRRDALGEMFSDILAALLVPALQQVSIAEHSAKARDDLLRVALATESYRRANGSFPETLDTLVPRYLKSVPNDSLSGRAFKFKRDGNRVVLYSVGRNGIDDGGVMDESGRRGQRDDIAVRLGVE